MKIKALRLASVLISAILLLSACTKDITGNIVLEGEIQGDSGEVIILSYISGQSIGYHYPEVTDNKFEFEMDNIQGFADLIVSVGAVEFGARVNAGDTLRMNFVVNKYAEEVEVSYEGATEKESRIWKDFYETYERWSTYNVLADRDTSISYDESLALLEANHRSFKEKYKEDWNEYYSHRSELAYGLMKAILLDLKGYEIGEDAKQWPEYIELLEIVDINDPDEITFPLINRWMWSVVSRFGDDPLTQYTEFFRQYGQKMTNLDIKAMLAELLANDCTNWLTSNDLIATNEAQFEEFLTEIERFAPEHPEIVESCRNEISATFISQPGSPAPEAVMVNPDGEQVLLSSLFGKVLYIDIWATWCGPCVKEGPYFKTLAEKYRNDDRILFVSLSTDDSDKPWIEFLDKEKPFWPQFRIDESVKPDFCDKVGISSIPRFVLIDTDGTFINADCARPSSAEIDKILEEALQ